MDLKVELGFAQLKNPLLTASGTFGYGLEMADFFDLDLCGAIILKGVYRDPRPGNPPPRIFETRAGLLNSVGLPGPGMAALADEVRALRTITSAPIVVNVCGNDDAEYLQVASFFDRMSEVSFLEINISCPNIKKAGKCIAQDAKHTFQLVKKLKSEISKALMIKLTPNTEQITAVAQAAEEAGADALSLVNTFLATAVDLEKRSFVFPNIFAGYSGPAIKPLAQRIFWQVRQGIKIPLIASGGVYSGRDVLEYILLGAAAVQIGSVNLSEPAAIVRLLNEIETEMKNLNIKSLQEIRGKIKCPQSE